MESKALDTLVRLASIGTAGICVLIIAVVGIIIYKLPPNTSEGKLSLIKSFLKSNVIIAVICAVSGIANAYFNQSKVETAQNETKQVAEELNREKERTDNVKSELNVNIRELKRMIEVNPQISVETRNQFRMLEEKVRKL